MKDCIIYSKPVVKSSEQNMQLVDQLAKQNQECKERIQALQFALSQFINNAGKNEKMLRKQVFRLKKQNAHLEAKTNLLGQQIQKQQQWNQSICQWMLQDKKQPFATEASVIVTTKKPHQFLPIYD